MTVVMRDHHGHEEPLRNATEAGKCFDDQVSSIMPNGECGQSLWFGPVDADPVIRVDVDIDARRAAIRWLEDGTYAVDLPPGEPITALDPADGGLTTISGRTARMRPDTVRTAVIEYVATSRRPSGLSWQSLGRTR